MEYTAPTHEAFEKQRALFRQIPADDLKPFTGKWVVSRDGVIVDFDVDLQKLSQRFFGIHGDVDVYCTQVGVTEPALIRTPRLIR